MTETSFAAVDVGAGGFEGGEFPLPDSLPDDAALLKMEACGICGSDLGGLRPPRGPGGEGGMFARAPHIMGHENLGRVYRIGKQASSKWGVKEGDRIALEEYV